MTDREASMLTYLTNALTGRPRACRRYFTIVRQEGAQPEPWSPEFLALLDGLEAAFVAGFPENQVREVEAERAALLAVINGVDAEGPAGAAKTPLLESYASRYGAPA